MKIKTKRGARRIRNQRVVPKIFTQGDVHSVTREFSRLYNGRKFNPSFNYRLREGDEVEILNTSSNPDVLPLKAPRRSKHYTHRLSFEHVMFTAECNTII